MKISKYFSIEELIASNTANILGIKNKPNSEITDNLRDFAVNILDKIREAYGKPIYVSSGYRCAELNKAVGGTKTSGHLFGSCADLYVRGNIKEFADFVKKFLDKNEIKYDELIFERSGKSEWLHFAYKGKDNKQRMKNFTIEK